MMSHFLRAYPPAQPTHGPSYWLPFRDGNAIVARHGQTLTLIEGGDEIGTLLQPKTVLYLGLLDGKPCLTCEVGPEFSLPDGWQESTQRAFFGRLDDLGRGIVGYAAQILLWQRTSRYCPVCAHETESIAGTWGRHCPNCGYERFPPVSPAILALVHDGKRMLLAHRANWPSKHYSCIAGFVEPGETLEECVKREVYEEVGLEVTDIEYVGSQPWPFPHQLMAGFTARYAGGTVQLDALELDDAQWFEPDALPLTPPPESLAYHIIINWVNAHRSHQ